MPSGAGLLAAERLERRARDAGIDVRIDLPSRSRCVNASRPAPEELVPAAVADRLIDRESPLRSAASTAPCPSPPWSAPRGVNRVQIADIEANRAAGSVRTLPVLADALRVAVDDILRA